MYANYKKNKRSFPWRPPALSLRKDGTCNPYHVLVSEVMLQQTQVDRVVPKYKAFIQQFSTFQKLAEAPLREVLTLWQGLGYNRRAKALWETAKIVTHEHNGKLPTFYSELVELPGIGSYTAGAILAFAYNKPSIFVETNIRTVLISEFFSKRKNIHDKEILERVERTLDRRNPREWYTALMDYGAYLKQRGVKVNARSVHYTKQTQFKGSEREMRGAIIRSLVEKQEGLTARRIEKYTGFAFERLQVQAEILLHEGLITRRNRRFFVV